MYELLVMSVVRKLVFHVFNCIILFNFVFAHKLHNHNLSLFSLATHVSSDVPTPSPTAEREQADNSIIAGNNYN